MFTASLGQIAVHSFVSTPNREAIMALIASGPNFYARISQVSAATREKSKAAYQQGWLDAHLTLTGVLATLMESKAGVAGNTSDRISHQLILLATFAQGLHVTETCVSEGQYAKAAAALRHDFEILVRLREVRMGVDKDGVQPNMRNAPPGTARFYGDLCKVVHPSNRELLGDLLGSGFTEGVRSTSAIPTFSPDLARSLYELHVFIILEIAREHIGVFMEMYPDDDATANLTMAMWLAALENLKREGFESS